MAWSAENATRAYLQTMKMGKRPKHPDVAEFLSALAAGSNARLMVESCGGSAGSMTLALIAAAHQTGGRVVCIVANINELRSSEEALGAEANCVEFVVGEAGMLLLNDYKEADFVLIDCNMKEHEKVLKAACTGKKCGGAVIMGYNAFQRGSWWSGSRTNLLPIGNGLQVIRIPATKKAGVGGDPRKSRWFVRVDQLTGEEHVFRIRSQHREEVAA
ncbi:hypothetical protein CKAN_01834100 [Cinnamomum micranthum f. kanehirae]|uniref:Uncharacterized protein n=1 Tax=Cinnamomum micranthum f. kanehirae TaxID=337451 RepID=A0A3S3NYL9_9MAGN|nr:hypothetical protein CKAN_01834100 [Cinnamomum micranthum f. kanehirae]